MIVDRFQLDKHGDFLEREKCQFIRENISNYEFLWAKYIGHDLKGSICPCNLSPKQNDLRKYISQLYYSIIRNLCILHSYKKKICNFTYEEDSADNHIELSGLISSFISCWGRIRDKESKVLENVFDKRITNTLQEKTETYYKGIRNFEQHSSDISITIEYGEIIIPCPEYLREDDRLSWFKEIGDRNKTFLLHFVEEALTRLQSQLNSNINKVQKKLDEDFCDFQFSYPIHDINHFATSGVTVTYKHV